MNLQRLGTECGGWTIDIDAVPDGSVVLDAGIGGDDSFSRELLRMRPNCTVLAIDPSQDSWYYYLKNPPPPGMLFLPQAVSPDGGSVRMRRGDDRSDSTAEAGMPGMTENWYLSPGVLLLSLVCLNRPSLVKLDIEGTEFAVLDQCLGVPQVAVEFHTVQMPHRRPEMEALLARFAAAGYRIIHRTERDEITLLREPR